MRSIWRPSVIFVVIKRLISNAGLVCFNILGLLLTVALMCSIPLYAEGNNEKLLQEELASRGDEYLPRSILFFRYLHALGGDLDLRRYEVVDRYLAQAPSALLGFPIQHSGRYVRSDTLKFFPARAEGQGEILRSDRIDYFSFAYMEDVEAHIQLLAGAFPLAIPIQMESWMCW